MSVSEQRALLHDMTICSGCGECVAACNEAHDITIEGDPENVRKLSATALTALIPIDEENTARHLCRHCLTPSCASVCPVQALHKSEFGSVIYDADKCMGCRYCMVACPFNVPTYEWSARVPSVRKCDMCIDRLRDGKTTACAEICPQEATIAGTREELLAEAHRRIKESPEDYEDHVYGEYEIGGTSVLFITPFPVEQLGFKPELGNEPLADLPWRILKRVPAIGVSVGASLLAMWWITGRRDEVAAAEARDAVHALHDAPRSNGRNQL